jgi:hypothetical protein
MKNKLVEKLEKIAGPLIGVSSGLAVGAIDTLTSGLPLLTTYCLGKFVIDINKGKDFSSLEKGNPWINFGSYLVGNGIPFYIKYSNEVNNFVEGVLK